ncbi:MAG: hypothetical protein ACQEVA_02430 [Myxococcota bacterium]
METLLLIIVLFAVHLAVLFSIALVISGVTSLIAVAGLGGRQALQKGEASESPRALPKLLGALGVGGAVLTTLTLGFPLFFGEHLVSPYLEGLRQQGGPDISLTDASLNIVGGKMRSDELRLRQDDGRYLYDIEVDTIDARLSPIAALGKNPRMSALSVTGVDGWLAPGDGEPPPAEASRSASKFYLGELMLEDIEIAWRPSVDEDAAGSLKIASWRTRNIDHEYTLLDLLGRTNATGEFLDGALEFTHEDVDEGGHASGWTLEDMSLSKAGAAIGGPMKFVREGDFTLDGRATWDEALEGPANFAFDAELSSVNFGPAAGDDSVQAKVLGALSDAVGDSIPKGTRSFSFSFGFELSPETLQNARSLYEYDVWKEIEDELKRAIIEEIGL